MSTADIDSETVIRLVSDAVTAILTRLQSKFGGTILYSTQVLRVSELNPKSFPHPVFIGKSLCMSVPMAAPTSLPSSTLLFHILTVA